ncbi:MAG: hypothetical protein CR986_02220 [Ignavibacteriae bacterium]|nr:MAG: hypothetical protein CR986_02220 [Ignavibacteriota bacterium]
MQGTEEDNNLENIKPYSKFSEIYAHLMKSVDYQFWAEYLRKIHKRYGTKNDLALEIASGNCMLAQHIRTNEFKKIFLSDLSLEMLKYNKTEYPAVCCNMLQLPFKVKFDFIFSTFDSINYLQNKKELKLFFEQIYNLLSENGCFVFDVALMQNSIRHVKKLNRIGKHKGIKYKQISKINLKDKIHKNILELEFKNGKTYIEEHTQKIFDFYYYFQVLDQTKLFVAECLEAFTFNHASPHSERVQFIVKRKN